MEYVTLDYARFGFSNKRRAQKFAQNYANNRRIVELKLTNIFSPLIFANQIGKATCSQK